MPVVADSPGNVDGSGCHVGGGQEASSAVVEENWDDDVLDMNADTSPFGNGR